MNPNPIIFAVDEHDRDDLPWPVPADHWFWQAPDRWVAVVADFHDDWWEGADPADIAARPDPWRIPITERPPSGTLIYSSPDGSEVTEGASDVVTAGARTVLDALQPTEWYTTDRTNTVVVSLDGTRALRVTITPTALPAQSPYDTGDNRYPERGACKHENLIGFWTVLVSGSVNDAGEIVELETDEGGCYQQALESDGPDEVQCRDCGAVVSRKAASDDGAS